MTVDANDIALDCGTSGLRVAWDNAAIERHVKAPAPSPLPLPPALTLVDWLKRDDISEPDFIMGEWLHTASRALIVGPTGLGKTNFGLALAISAAADLNFMYWQSRRPVRVLYIDGEMSRRLLRQRSEDAARRAGAQPEGLIILSREDCEDMPPLNAPEGQRFIDSYIAAYGPFDLIIFDNIQALCVGDLREETAWAPVIPWMKNLSKRSIGQIWFHHTGHDETRSYGSKAKEWQLDTVILMEGVERPDADLAFGLNFTKARERTPDNRDDFEPVTMCLRGDQWEYEREAGKQTTGAAALALKLLKQAVDDAGEIPPASNHIPANVRVVRSALWRDYCDKGTISGPDTKPDSKQKAFKRAAHRLQALGKIGVWGEFVWLS